MPRPRERSAAKARAQQAAPQPPREGQATTLITVLLALALLGVGVAGYQAATLLQYAVFGPSGINASPASLASFACDAFKRQDYARLVKNIDPTPTPPAVTTPFDAKKTVARLQSLDASQGKIIACVARPYSASAIVSTDNAVRYEITVRRAKGVGSVSGALVMRQQTSGQRLWLIGRDSSFLAPIPGAG